jgi:hypothetical protein
MTAYQLLAKELRRLQIEELRLRPVEKIDEKVAMQQISKIASEITELEKLVSNYPQPEKKVGRKKKEVNVEEHDEIEEEN